MFDWEADARPVLVAIYRAMKDAASQAPGFMGPIVGSLEINEALGRTDPDPHTDQVLSFLSEAGYLNDEAYGAGDGRWRLVKLSEKGLQEVAGWPATPGENYAAKLLDVLDERIAEASDPEERTRLQRFREAVVSIGTGVVTGVLTDLARRHGA